MSGHNSTEEKVVDDHLQQLQDDVIKAIINLKKYEADQIKNRLFIESTTKIMGLESEPVGFALDVADKFGEVYFVRNNNKKSPSPDASQNITETLLNLTLKTRDVALEEQRESDPLYLYKQLCGNISKSKDFLISYIEEKTKTISKVEEGQKIVNKLIAKSLPVYVDCKGINMGNHFKGQITMVVVGSVGETVRKAYMFDVNEKPGLSIELKRLLESNSIPKVMHDCRKISAALHKLDIKLHNVFDTQSAYTVIRQGKKTNEHIISLTSLCQEYGWIPAPTFGEEFPGFAKKKGPFGTSNTKQYLIGICAASRVLFVLPTLYGRMKKQISSDSDKNSLNELIRKQITELCDKCPIKKDAASVQLDSWGAHLNNNDDDIRWVTSSTEKKR